MKRDIKTIYIVAAAYPLALVSAFFVPDKIACNLMVAGITAVFAAVAFALVKKRLAPDIRKREAAIVCFAAALFGVLLLYLSGLIFGFVKIALNVNVVYIYLLPAVVTIACGEVLRRILLSQEKKGVAAIVYIAFVLADTALFTDKSAFLNAPAFMRAFGLVVLPALTANLLYCKLSKTYGAEAVIPYRAVVALYPYAIPYRASVPNALLGFLKIIFPLLVLLFLRLLYQKRRAAKISRRNAAVQSVVTATCVAIMLVCVCFVSGVFTRKMMVVGSESMSGALEKGDVIVYDSYRGENLENGQIILFDRDGATIIHRIIDVKKINGVCRYYTKGDANEGADSGYITSADLVGIVRMRVPFLGYPTVWLYEIFK